MPAPVAIAAGGIAKLGTAGVSETIALGALTIGVGAGIASIPTNVVGISSISLSASPGVNLVVGDRVRLQAFCTVSFGDVWSGGSGKAALFEIDRGGTKKLQEITFRQDARNPRPIELNADLAGKLHDRTTQYFVAIEVTGEDDASGTLIDVTVTRHRMSETISLRFDRPYAVVTSHLSSPEITHGESDIFQAVAANRGQFDVSVYASWNSTYDSSSFLIDPPQVPARTDNFEFSRKDYRNEHSLLLHRERNPIQYVVEFIVYGATMQIRYPAAPGGSRIIAIWLDKPLPRSFPPAHVTRCRVPEPKKVALVIPGDPPFGANPPQGEYAFAYTLTAVDGTRLRHTATVYDDYGAEVSAKSSEGGTTEIAGTFAGALGTLVARPDDSSYAPLAVRFPFDEAETVIEATPVGPAVGPDVRGFVTVPDRGSVAGAFVSLVAGSRTETIDTFADGSFRVGTFSGDWADGPVRIEVRLPKVPEVQWETELLTLTVERDDAECGKPVIVTAAVAKSEAALVDVSGSTTVRDEGARTVSPVPGATVRLTSGSGQVAEAIVDEGGAWSLAVPPAVYGIDVTPPDGLPIRTFGPRILHVAGKRDGVDISLRLPRPQCLDLGDRVRVVAPGEGYGVALVAGAERVAERVLEGSVLEIMRSELDDLGVTSVALTVDGASSGLMSVGPGSPDRTTG